MTEFSTSLLTLTTTVTFPIALSFQNIEETTSLNTSIIDGMEIHDNSKLIIDKCKRTRVT